MNATRIVIAVFGIGSCALLVGHWINLPDYPVTGWFWSPRFTKSVAYQITSVPYEQGSWTSLWGINRPVRPRPHAILSELQIKVQHESRENLVHVEVTGDSEQEVNAFLETLRSDFEHTFAEPRPSVTGLPERHGRLFIESPEKVAKSYYFRQKYLWLLLVNIVVAGIVIVLHREKRTEPNASGNSAPRRA